MNDETEKYITLNYKKIILKIISEPELLVCCVCKRTEKVYLELLLQVYQMRFYARLILLLIFADLVFDKNFNQAKCSVCFAPLLCYPVAIIFLPTCTSSALTLITHARRYHVRSTSIKLRITDTLYWTHREMPLFYDPKKPNEKRLTFQTRSRGTKMKLPKSDSAKAQ